MPSPLPTTISRYKILQRIGEGGMGSLYLARDPAIDRLVAIKLLRRDVESDELRERFAREARAVGRLRHQNIVVVFDVGEDDARPFIAMEYVEGETLAAIIRERRNVPIERKLQWIEQLCDGLAYAHRAGLVHRDVKPANLMVDNDGLLKILDFGVARLGHSAATGITQTGVLMGTLNYMSPEQMAGRPVDHRSDIFAVGAVAYELLAYQRAFPGDITDGVLHRILHEPPQSLQKAVPGIDAALVQVIDTALIKDRDQRYQDLDDMRADLETVRQHLKPEPSTLAPSARVPAETLAPVSSKMPSAPPRPATAVRDPSARLRFLLENAQRALHDGLYEEASAACDQMLALDSAHVAALDLKRQAQLALGDQQMEIWLDEARDHLARGALDEAGRLTDQALQLNPQSSDARRVRSEIDEAQRVAAEAERRRLLAAEAERKSSHADRPPTRRDTYSDKTIVTLPPKSLRVPAEPSSDATRLVLAAPASPVERTPVPSNRAAPGQPSVDSATRNTPKPTASEGHRSAPAPLLPQPVARRVATSAPTPVAKPAGAWLKALRVSPAVLGAGVAVTLALVVGAWWMLTPPRALSPGTLILAPIPWANVETIASTDSIGPDYAKGCPTTPCLLRLPPGQYNVRLSGPGFETVTVPVTIRSGDSQQVTHAMKGFNADDAIKDILQKQE